MGGVKVGGPMTAVTLTGGDSCLHASRRVTGVVAPPSPTGFTCGEPSATGNMSVHGLNPRLFVLVLSVSTYLLFLQCPR